MNGLCALRSLLVAVLLIPRVAVPFSLPTANSPRPTGSGLPPADLWRGPRLPKSGDPTAPPLAAARRRRRMSRKGGVPIFWEKNGSRHQTVIATSTGTVFAVAASASGRSDGGGDGDGLSSKQQTLADNLKDDLLRLVSAVPANRATPRRQTKAILEVVRRLEGNCPTDASRVIDELAGNWELLWTAQDPRSPESSSGGNNPFSSWINPLEDQSYSNNPAIAATATGRSNPVLPRPVQDMLEDASLIQTATSVGNGNKAGAIRSTQAVDVKRGRVRNVVAFEIPFLRRKASLTVLIQCKPNRADPRRVDVKFESCRVVLLPTTTSPSGRSGSNSDGGGGGESRRTGPLVPAAGNLDITIPLGIAGPTGWLRTTYIDEGMRITRGHKGSVFVLSRRGASKKAHQRG